MFETRVEPGMLLANRYEIQDLLSEEGDCRSWRARDNVLARSVVVLITDSASPVAADLLSAAKLSSQVADTRFLHVLDAAREDGLAYVVREWAGGRSLDLILSEGPLSARRAAWIIREAAAAVAAAHRQGITHGCLRPDALVVTSSGGIKIVGLGILAAVNQTEATDDPERRDTRQLGQLLYASLTARWPDGPASGLLAAPTEHGRLLRPRQVRAGVPRRLDLITDRILGNPPRAGTPIVAAADVEEALTLVLAGEPLSATETGVERVEAPPPPSTPPALLPPKSRPKSLPDEVEPAPPGMPPAQRPNPLRRSLWWTAVAILAAGAVLLVYLVTQQGDPGKNPPPARSTSSSHQPIAGKAIGIVDARDFDPRPLGSGDENPAEVKYAIDGDPSTSWTTLRYDLNPQLGGLKPGVGLVLDLGGVKTVRRVVVDLGGTGTTVELRAAGPHVTGAPPTRSADDYRLVATLTNVGSQAVFTLDRPVQTRYLLVWLTRLPPIGNNRYRGSISGIKVTG